MSIDLEAIEARVNAATPGPWVYVDNGFDGYIMSASEHLIVGGEPAEGRIEPDDPNADFIAHSREDIPALLAEVERLNERIELLSAIIDAYIEICDKNRGTIAKLMKAYQSVTAERDAAKDCIDVAEERHTRIADTAEYVKPNTGIWHIVHVALDEIKQYREAGKERKHG